MARYNKTNFLIYMNKPMDKIEIYTLYKEHKIINEKCVLFNDFLQSLFHIIFDTYMGDDVTSVEQQVKHYNWSWDKNIDNFIKEALFFDKDGVAYNYFLEFMLEVFYLASEKDDSLYEKVFKLWLNTFDYYGVKSNSDIDMLIEIYKIMDNDLFN